MKTANSCIAVQTPTVPGALTLTLHWMLEPVTSPFCLSSLFTARNYIFHLLHKRVPRTD